MRYIEISEINVPQRKLLTKKGYYIYGERDWEGSDYGIEPGNVIVNNIGYLITDEPIDMDDDCIAASDFFKTVKDEIPYKEIEPYLSKYENRNFHYHIKGNNVSVYFCTRTYSDAIARKRVRTFIKNRVKSKARAYRFGHRPGEDFYETYSKIKTKNALSL